MSHLLANGLKQSKYRLLGLVGQGQFGRVYCAIHRKTNRLYALKELNRDRFPTHKFLRELRFLLSLQHPNIVTCHALEHIPTGRYLVMDYCEGGTLRSLLTEDARPHPSLCLRLVADVLAGLQHAHSREIVHCDIKPDNILLSLTQQGWTARISDFGIARLSEEISNRKDATTGSPAYMAPERFYGQYSYASDLYAVGIVLFELLVGHRPFSGTPSELMSAHWNQPVQIPDEIPPPVRSILLTALQKLQARRFRSAAEMLKAVQQAATILQYATAGSWRVDAPQAAAASPSYGAVCSLDSPTQQILTASSPLRSSSTDRDSQSHQIVYRVSGNRILGHCDRTDHSGNPDQVAASEVSVIQLPETIRMLVVQRSGNVAVTERCIYQISADFAHVQPIAQFHHPFLAAIASNARWIATVTEHDDRQILKFWNLSFWGNVKPFSAENLTIERPLDPTTRLLQINMLDSRHVAIFSHIVSPAQTQPIGILMQLWTRRGHLLGSFRLPIAVQSIWLGADPYRLVAPECGSNSILLVDLKPLRIQRVALGIKPTQIVPTPWGMVLASESGQIVLLSRHGQILGRVAGPKPLSAIAEIAPYRLLIATWNGSQGGWYSIDLQQLDLDIVF